MTTQGIAAALLLMTALTANAEGPAQDLKVHVDRAIQVLSDPATKGQPDQRRAQVRKIADEIFDFQEMGKRAMGVHWQQLPASDRNRFVRLFSDLLDRAYFDKIDSYQGEKVRYLEARVDGTEATVPTRVITNRGTEIPVDYRMMQQQGRWMVYDVVIEGVSLVSNYRSQFDRIVRTASVGELMKRLEAQVAGQASPRGTPREPRGR